MKRLRIEPEDDYRARKKPRIYDLNDENAEPKPFDIQLSILFDERAGREVDIDDVVNFQSVTIMGTLKNYEEIFEKLVESKVLSSLTFYGVFPHKQEVHMVHRLMNLPTIKTLNFINFNFGHDFDADILKSLCDNTTITELNFYWGTTATRSEQIAEIIRKNTTLQFLGLGANEFYDEHIDPLLSALPFNNTLRALDLSRNFLTDNVMSRLDDALATNTSLVSLSLNVKSMKDFRYVFIQECQRNEVLQFFQRWPLDLEGYPIQKTRQRTENVLSTFFLCCNHVDVPEDVYKLVCKFWGNVIKTKLFDSHYL